MYHFNKKMNKMCLFSHFTYVYKISAAHFRNQEAIVKFRLSSRYRYV